MQIKEKTHVPVIICFSDYSFMYVLLYIICNMQMNTSLLSLEKICYVAFAINRAGQLICLRVSLHERNR